MSKLKLLLTGLAFADKAIACFYAYGSVNNHDKRTDEFTFYLL